MASITLTSGSTTREIELLDAINDDTADNVTIGSYFAELTDDISLTNGTPLLTFTKNGTTKYIREVFGPDYLQFKIVFGRYTRYVTPPIEEGINSIYGTRYYTIDWGDGSAVENFSSDDLPRHSYDDSGAGESTEEYTVTLWQQEGYTDRDWLAHLSFSVSMGRVITALTAWPKDNQCMVGDANTVGDEFMFEFFADTNLQSPLPDNFSLPQNLTSVGESFCAGMFRNCLSLTTLPSDFSLPQNLTSVGESFCAEMFTGAWSLVNTGGLTAPLGIEGHLPARTCDDGQYGAMFAETEFAYDPTLGFPECAWG